MKNYTCIIFTILTLNLNAQGTLRGFVCDNNKVALQGVVVKLYGQNDSLVEKKLISYSISRSDGLYNFHLSPSWPHYTIEFFSLGFQPLSLQFKNNQILLPDTIFLIPGFNYLDTVYIKHNFIYNIKKDAITFNADFYRLNNEKNIEQLLDKLPGISIDENGIISFNGNTISKILLNGDDLFKNKYTELSRNAPAEIIDKIDVISNFQKDTLLLLNNITEGYVLNLHLKKHYLNKIFGYIEGASGFKAEKKPIYLL